jgi:hypothetical protein
MNFLAAAIASDGNDAQSSNGNAAPKITVRRTPTLSVPP